MREFRCTFPGRYGPTSLGHDDPAARQGYYVQAATAAAAAVILRAQTGSGETVDVQIWEPTHGSLCGRF